MTREFTTEDVYGDEITVISIDRDSAVVEKFGQALILIRVSQEHFWAEGMFTAQAARNIAVALIAFADDIDDAKASHGEAQS